MDGEKSIVTFIDNLTKSGLSINYDHHEIHEGNAFAVSDTRLVDTTTSKWQIQTPVDKNMHIILDVFCTGEIEANFYEGSDRTNGTTVLAKNRNRDSALLSTATVTHTPTSGTTDGTILEGIRTGATGVGSKTISIGEGRGGNEWVLKKNTKYVLTAQTFAAVYVTFKASWYET